MSSSDEKDERDKDIDNGDSPPSIADALAKLYYKENIRKTEHGIEPIRRGDEKIRIMMNNIVAKSLKTIEKLKQSQDDTIGM